MEHKKILIVTGIYPPKIGGPAQYAKNLKLSLEEKGHQVSVQTFTLENYLPTGIRHIFFFLKILIPVVHSDFIIALDTWSVGFPTVVASKIFRKKIILRTGGDFLWEQYTERTKNTVLLEEFYSLEKSEKNNFSLKERIIFFVTGWTLRHCTYIVFSTLWQKDIFMQPYKLEEYKTSIIENYYGEKISDREYEAGEKEFIASSRNIVIKNEDVLKRVFERVKTPHREVKLFTENISFPDFMERLSKSYAVICVSVGEISPNLILDAIRYNRPFICTTRVGIYNRIHSAGIFVDPLNSKEIEESVLRLLTPEGYKEAKEKVRSFNLIHTWDAIAEEFLDLFTTI